MHTLLITDLFSFCAILDAWKAAEHHSIVAPLSVLGITASASCNISSSPKMHCKHVINDMNGPLNILRANTKH